MEVDGFLYDTGTNADEIKEINNRESSAKARTLPRNSVSISSS